MGSGPGATSGPLTPISHPDLPYYNVEHHLVPQGPDSLEFARNTIAWPHPVNKPAYIGLDEFRPMPLATDC
jgi:hypothetical protein